MKNDKVKIGICKVCKKFLRVNLQKSFCSRTCQGKYKSTHNRTTFKCKICGKLFIAPPGRKRKFCSHICFSKYQHLYLVGKKSSLWKGGGKKQICLFCKREFKRKRKRKFCSRICYARYRKTLCGERSPIFKHDMKMSICQICGKELTRQQTIYKHKFCSRKCFSNHLSKTKSGIKQPQYRGRGNPNFGNHILQGKNNPNWKGGVSREPYSIDFNEKLKEEIRKRDNYQCQNKECNMTEEEHLIVYGFNLSIHHVDYKKKYNNKRNLISLCFQCNGRANFNRNYWKTKFTKLINKKYKYEYYKRNDICLIKK